MSRVNESDVIGMLQEHGAIATGHFELLSGLHSPTFIRTAVVLQYPHMTQKLAMGICSKFPQGADGILASSAGAVLIGQEVARRKKCRFVSVERSRSGMYLNRDHRLSRGERILVMQDVLTTGRSTAEAVSLILAYGAKVIGVTAIVDRSSMALPLRVPFRPLAYYPTRLDTPESCLLCARGVPLTRLLEEREPRV
jgi:orotate phosphoribosyltransferase